MSGRTGAFVVVAALLLAAGGTVEAARLPDWCKRIAAQAPPLPEAVTEYDSRILLQETLLTVDDDGTLRTRRRTASQALNPEAGEIGIGYFPFDEDTQKLRSKAWHLSSEGKTKKSSGASEMDLTLADVFLTDAMTRVVGMPGVETGSLVFFEFNAEERPKQLAYQELFFNAVPVRSARVVLTVPEGWQVRYTWLRRPGPEPTIDGTRYTWQLDGIEAPPLPKKLSRPYSTTAPLLQIGVVPPASAAIEAAAFDSWAEVGDWWLELAAGRDAADDAIRGAAESIAPPDGGGVDEIVAIARHVRDRVRYVAKEIGIGGYRPHAAVEVLANLYGDCKDKGTLLRAMLAARGLDSYPMLVNASRPDTVSPEVPSLYAFNHFVVGVPLPAGIEPPPSVEPAVIDAGELGRLLVIDTTNEFVAIGELPASFGGKQALVVADGGRSRLVRLPDDRPQSHGVSRGFEVELADGGAATLRIVERFWGEPAARLRMSWADSSREFETNATLELERSWTGSTLESLDVTPEDDDGRFVRRAVLRLPAPGVAQSEPLLNIFPRATRELPRISVTRREEPVVYPHAMTIRVDSRIVGVPASYVAPDDASRSGDGWSATAEYSMEDGVLEGRWELRLARREYPPDAFAELKRLWSTARRVARKAVDRGA